MLSLELQICVLILFVSLQQVVRILLYEALTLVEWVGDSDITKENIVVSKQLGTLVIKKITTHFSEKKKKITTQWFSLGTI